MLVICSRIDDHNLLVADPSLGGLNALNQGDIMHFYQLLPGVPTRENPFLGDGRVLERHLVTDAESKTACTAADSAMQLPPFNAKSVGLTRTFRLA